MSDLDKNTIAKIDLGNGWAATVSLADGMSAQRWRMCLADPESLLDEPQKVIRPSGSTRVIVKTIQPGHEPMSVVIKDEIPKSGMKSFFRSFQPAKSKRNFAIAQKLLQRKIPVVSPLAALEKTQGLRTVRSIYITSYSETSHDMHNFIRDNIGKIDFHDRSIKNQFLNQSITILAMLDSNGMWHRDAKAGNFLADLSDGKYRVSLLDMDGIKRRPKVFAGRLRIRTIAKLAATLMWNPFVTRSDYLRTLTIYCDIADINKEKRKKLFKDISATAVAIRLMTMVTDSRAS